MLCWAMLRARHIIIINEIAYIFHGVLQPSLNPLFNQFLSAVQIGSVLCSMIDVQEKEKEEERELILSTEQGNIITTETKMSYELGFLKVHSGSFI